MQLPHKSEPHPNHSAIAGKKAQALHLVSRVYKVKHHIIPFANQNAVEIGGTTCFFLPGNGAVFFDYFNRLYDGIAEKEEELKQVKRQLQKLDEVKKVLESA